MKTYIFAAKNFKHSRRPGSNTYDLVIGKIENNEFTELGSRPVNSSMMMGFLGEVNCFLIEKGFEKETVAYGKYYHHTPEKFGYQIIEIGQRI
jgi:hypothetical protein